MWVEILKKINPTTGCSKKILRKQLVKWKIYDLIIDPKEWIINIGLQRGNLKNMYKHIDRNDDYHPIKSTWNIPEHCRNYKRKFRWKQQPANYREDPCQSLGEIWLN